MATTVSTTIPADNSSLGYWEKTVTDVNNVDESFANARDLGYTRLIMPVSALSANFPSIMTVPTCIRFSCSQTALFPCR